MKNPNIQFPRGPLIMIAVSLGILAGLGVFTLHYAEGLSYFSTDPKACANCHIMQPQFDSWQKASHHGVAACVDCHLPHTFVAKYLAKAENGYYHSKGFTFQDFPEPIMIKAKNADILQKNCLSCHGDLTQEMVHGATKNPDAVRCVHCHATVGHGDRAGLGGPLNFDTSERISQ
jgi:cytochrome c nitrite reductase small subunit